MKDRDVLKKLLFWTLHGKIKKVKFILRELLILGMVTVFPLQVQAEKKKEVPDTGVDRGVDTGLEKEADSDVDFDTERDGCWAI